MTWVNPLQRTEAWINSRRGKITASRVHRVVNGTVRGWASFAAELAYEASPEYVHEEINVASIENGKLYEPVAIANAELDLGEEFEPVGFVEHPEYPFLGCSSDFLARGRTHNGEVKCPLLLEKHMLVYMNRQMPKDHWPQVQLQMAVHDIRTTIFISYYSGRQKISDKMRTAIVEVHRDDRYVDEMYKRCLEFQAYREGLQAVVPHRHLPSLPDLF